MPKDSGQTIATKTAVLTVGAVAVVAEDASSVAGFAVCLLVDVRADAVAIAAVTTDATAAVTTVALDTQQVAADAAVAG